VRALVIVAVNEELDAVLGSRERASIDGPAQGCCTTTPAGELVVVVGGVGMAAAAAVTAVLLARSSYDVVISAGIAGGFDAAPIGSAVVAHTAIAADFGLQTEDAFVSIAALGYGVDRYDVEPRWADAIAARVLSAGLPLVRGDVATVATITGTAAGATRIGRDGAVAEAMEGFAVATAAAMFSVPFAEVRTVSNAVGARDVSAWRIDDALAALASAFDAIAAEPWPW